MHIFGFLPKLGGDPEFFIRNRKDNKIISAEKFFPGKEDKMEVKHGTGLYSSKVGTLHFDGIQAEINFHPMTCREYVQDNIFICLRKAKQVVGNDNIITTVPSVVMPLKDLREAHPEARRFGCEPDWNAYTMQKNVCEIDGETHRTRYAGGHIHIGWNTLDYSNKYREDAYMSNPERHLEFIKLSDIIIGIMATMLDQSKESKRRRKHYGRAGDFRPTEYGIEYRTLSSFWLTAPALTSFIMGLAKLSYVVMRNPEVKDKFFRATTEVEVKDAINSGSLRKCINVYNKIKPILVKYCSSKEFPLYDLRYFEFIVNYGALKAFGDFESVHKNWQLDLSLVPHGGTAIGWLRSIGKLIAIEEPRDFMNSIKSKYRNDGPFTEVG